MNVNMSIVAHYDNLLNFRAWGEDLSADPDGECLIYRRYPRSEMRSEGPRPYSIYDVSVICSCCTCYWSMCSWWNSFQIFTYCHFAIDSTSVMSFDSFAINFAFKVTATWAVVIVYFRRFRVDLVPRPYYFQLLGR